MIILSYLCPCCAVFAARFSNLTKFECSHRRDAITYTHDIFHKKCKRSQQTTRKISNLYIENIYHHLTLQQKFRLLLNKGVGYMLDDTIFKMAAKHHIEFERHSQTNIQAGIEYRISDVMVMVKDMGKIGRKLATTITQQCANIRHNSCVVVWGKLSKDRKL